MIDISACILSYAITKGMKSYGPKGILTQKTNTKKPLINCQIETIKNITNNIYVVSGFGRDRILKNITDKNVVDIYNENYDFTNDGYAMQLLLDQITSSHIIILCDGIIIKIDEKTIANNQSVIYCTNANDKALVLGCTYDNNTNILEHIFYEVGYVNWCETILLAPPEISILKKYIANNNVENMFLFELINESIKLGANYSIRKVASKNIKKIQSIKDANKVRVIKT